MGLTLPNPRSTVFIPVVPDKATDAEAIKTYLKSLTLELERQFGRQFDNVYSIVSTGTSGSFVDSDGNTVTVESGIITGLS